MGALSSAVPSWRLQVHLGCVRLSPACPCRCLHTCHLRPARHYPRLWIRPPSSGDRRDLNPPDQCAAWRTLFGRPTPRRASLPTSLSLIGSAAVPPADPTEVSSWGHALDYGPVPCRPHTPWCGGWMRAPSPPYCRLDLAPPLADRFVSCRGATRGPAEVSQGHALVFRTVPSAYTLVRWVDESAFASILQARPCPTFGRPVRHGVAPSTTARYCSANPSDPTSRWAPCPPQFRRGGSRSTLAVSGFRPRARLGVSIPATCGRRGITPAFGYGPPHPGAGGTSTLPTSALPGAQYGLIRLLHSVHHRFRNSSFPLRPRFDCRGGMKTSQVPAKDIRTCLGSLTPWSPPSPHPLR